MRKTPPHPPKPEDLSLNPGIREPTATSCTLNSTCMPWMFMHTYKKCNKNCERHTPRKYTTLLYNAWLMFHVHFPCQKVLTGCGGSLLYSQHPGDLLLPRQQNGKINFGLTLMCPWPSIMTSIHKAQVKLTIFPPSSFWDLIYFAFIYCYATLQVCLVPEKALRLEQQKIESHCVNDEIEPRSSHWDLSPAHKCKFLLNLLFVFYIHWFFCLFLVFLR